VAALLPTVAITAPADGVTVQASPVTVTGTSTGSAPVAVAVNGVAASLGAGGAWAASVPLAPGANTVVATGTDTNGNVVRAQRSVVYAPPVTKPPVPSNVFTLKVIKPKAGATSVKFTLTLPGPGAVAATLKGSTTLAKTNMTAKAKGKLTLTLRLSKKALALISKRHTLKAKLSVRFTPTGGTAATKTAKVTLRAKKKR
jgi:hypothetical protein